MFFENLNKGSCLKTKVWKSIFGDLDSILIWNDLKW